VYRRDIDEKMKAATAAAAEENVRFGALIIEPVVMGAGGMLLVDPLYQRVLVQVKMNHAT
jgi:dethiobiotin synthetase/adenosylmethionine--8-amino-7-oxononanoate aminotransferase